MFTVTTVITVYSPALSPLRYTTLTCLFGSISRGYTIDPIKVIRAGLTIIALLCNNLWQQEKSVTKQEVAL
ncbi:hypothetical protein [Bacillus gaemokensis]|uniref:hypothetical protein n=1 Tax=Bacillus gaemokensis TaxID=574375 RepID=UPI001290783D|nr:hypothetical protein [Bacillus gaemokensis]